MKKKLCAAILAGAVAATLAACGSSSSDTAATTASTAAAEATTTAAEATTTAADAATTEAAADTTSAASESTTDYSSLVSESKYLSDGVMTVGLNATFPPFEYAGSDGTPVGFDPAMMQEICNRLGVELDIQDMDFDGIIGAIGTKIDVAATGMTITDERKEAVNFSDPYYDATQYVLVKSDSTIASADDLKGLTLDVQTGTTGQTVAEGIDGATVNAVKSFNQTVQDLLNGSCDAVIIDAKPAEAFVSQHPDDLKALSGDQFGFDTEQYGIAMPKDDDAMLQAINGALSDMKADGTYDSLVDQYINNYEAE
ncbi:MAG TPA: basic amino acid ABC transporter substrate-binding protein [Lachnospiraceae bacterium]|nr:basic amino acid ABC transporter substrate-binding protein [Lachnospiraceae bacterium]